MILLGGKTMQNFNLGALPPVLPANIRLAHREMKCYLQKRENHSGSLVGTLVRLVKPATGYWLGEQMKEV